VPTEDGAGCVCRPCLPWWWRSLFAVAMTAEMTYQVSADQPAVVEAACKYAAHFGLIGDWAIASFKEIAAALTSRARSTEVFSGCLDIERERRARAVRPARCAPAAGIRTGRRARRGRLGNPHGSGQPGRPRVFADGAGVRGPDVTATVQGVSTSRVAMLTLRGSTRSRGGGRRLRRGAGVVILGRSGGRRGDSRRPPACSPGLGRSGDALRIARRAGDGGGR
jgi:hypothetical protein